MAKSYGQGREVNVGGSLDLSALCQFRATDLLAQAAAVHTAAGAPLHVMLDSIEFDPAQPRRAMRDEGLA